MTSVASSVLFLVSAAFALVGAIVTASAKRPLRAAVGLLVHIIALAGLYLTLTAELLAAIQLLVYAGAVVVLFVFVIMLIGPAAAVERSGKGLMARLFSLIFMAMISFTLAQAVGHYDVPVPPVPADFGTVEGVGKALYGQAAIPFELVSVTLLVAILGALAIARRRTPLEAAELKKLRAERGEAAAGAKAGAADAPQA